MLTQHTAPGLLATVILMLMFSACSISPHSPKSQAPGPVVPVEGPAPGWMKDSGPSHDVHVDHIPDAIPTPELVTLAGNRSPYTVLGKTYHIVFDTRDFTETGYASWYGNKFHGRKTSNGETYDMYAMTAAHKTLPIPCYVSVTNLENGRKVIVRVNDRGPFHSERVIDLSYTAAKKLDFLTKGTAKVKVELINAQPKEDIQPPIAPGQPQVAKGDQPRTYLQLGAFSQKQSAVAMQERVREVTGYPVLIKPEAARNLYKVYVGPLLDNFDLLTLRQKLVDENLAEAHVVEM